MSLMFLIRGIRFSIFTYIYTYSIRSLNDCTLCIYRASTSIQHHLAIRILLLNSLGVFNGNTLI